MDAKEIKRRLIKFQKEYPELTFDNNGFEYLSPDIKEKYKTQINEISELLKEFDENFVRFDNFKPIHGKNEEFYIRYQAHWSESFIGVVYLNINEIYHANNKKEPTKEI